MRRSLAAVLAAAFALALGGGALAGNGNGHGNDGSAPGNSENAPGQLKQQEPAQQPSSPSAAPQQPAASEGVKPSNDTAKGTRERADSGKTKLYGNGKTAGGIATSRGAPGSTMLHGPGNSQPHKVTACGHRHEVDVHAVTSYSDGACAAKTETKTKPAPVVEPVLPQPKPETKVYICHATGSSTSPYVLIHVSENALAAHTAHQDGDDIVLGSTAGTCPTPKPPPLKPSVQPSVPPPVQAPPPAAPAQPTTVTPPPAPAPAPTPPAPAIATATPPSAAPVAAPAPEQAASAPSGGVLGLQATLPPKHASSPHGVLGTTQNIASRTLPFTGIELWVFALVAGVLVAGGFALRRGVRGTP